MISWYFDSLTNCSVHSSCSRQSSKTRTTKKSIKPSKKSSVIAEESVMSSYLKKILSQFSKYHLHMKFNLEGLCVSQLLSPVPLFATPWWAALQAPLSMGFSRQEYWSGLPCPPPEDLSNTEIEPGLLHCRQILYQLSHQESFTHTHTHTHTHRKLITLYFHEDVNELKC